METVLPVEDQTSSRWAFAVHVSAQYLQSRAVLLQEKPKIPRLGGGGADAASVEQERGEGWQGMGLKL